LAGSLVAANARAADASPNCDPNSLQCVVSTPKGPFHYESKDRLFTDIDTGSHGEKGVSVRARFSIDPVGDQPTMVLDMTTGPQIVASWSEPGSLTLRPITAPQSNGTLKIHYTLTPSLEASFFGLGISYDASQLISRIPGGSFHYDVTGSAKIVPWGFAPTSLTMPAPALDDSQIYAIGLDQLGVPPDITEGTLAVNATTKPTFVYKTSEVRVDAGRVSTADGSAKIPVVDADAMDVTAVVTGDLTFTGSLDVRPTVHLDSIDGFPTFGLIKIGFTVASKSYEGTAPKGIGWNATQFHIPLPNIKVPDRPVDMGSAASGQGTEQTVTIASTGELGGKLTFTSSDPQFTVPSGTIDVASKSQYDLKIAFKSAGGGAASADITVKSNDPVAPVQSFHVAANGAPLDPKDPNSTSGKTGEPNGPGEPQNQETSGCNASGGATDNGGVSAIGLMGLAIVLSGVGRRRSHARRS
jgi:hypothetical protein